MPFCKQWFFDFDTTIQALRLQNSYDCSKTKLWKIQFVSFSSNINYSRTFAIVNPSFYLPWIFCSPLFFLVNILSIWIASNVDSVMKSTDNVFNNTKLFSILTKASSLIHLSNC